MYSNATAAVSHSYVLRVKWFRIELPMIINTCAVSVIPKDLLKKWVLKCVEFIRLMPVAIDP